MLTDVAGFFTKIFSLDFFAPFPLFFPAAGMPFFFLTSPGAAGLPSPGISLWFDLSLDFFL